MDPCDDEGQPPTIRTHKIKKGRSHRSRKTQRRFATGHVEEHPPTGRPQGLTHALRRRDKKGERNYSAYVPDLPGCVSVGNTLEEAKAEIREAIEFHLEGMREEGLPIPKP